MALNIGFDFDKVFVDYPPLVPSFVIDYLYKNPRKKSHLTYRIPGFYEQKFRLATHHPLLRHPIQDNIDALKKISQGKKIKTYLISSRFSFLKNRTEELVHRTGLDAIFTGIYFNYENSQPHKFKEKTISKLRIDKYVDDDIDLLLYLSKKMPLKEYYWLDGHLFANKLLRDNIHEVHSIEEFRQKYL